MGSEREALEAMVWQFAYRSVRGKRRMLHTAGLSALECAFEVLGWADPYCPPKSPGCDYPGCREWATCGTPTASGYKSGCSDHPFERLYEIFGSPPIKEGEHA